MKFFRPKLILSILVIFILCYTVFKVADKIPSVAYFRETFIKCWRGWLFYSCCFFFTNYLRSLRWRYLVKSQVVMSAFQAWGQFQWLFMIKSISPFMTGEVVRALWLKSNGGSGTFGAGVFLFEKIADIIVLLMFSFICYFFFFYTAGESLDIFIYCGFFLVGVFGLVLNSHRFSFLFDFAAQLAQRSLFTQKHLLKRVLALKQALITELNAEQRLVVLALTIMIWGGLALGMSYAMNLLGTLNHWTQGGGLLVAANFAGFISPLPANIGTYQFAGSNILSLYGVQLTDAICVTIILHFVMLFQVCFVGLITFWLYGGSLKTISNEGEV